MKNIKLIALALVVALSSACSECPADTDGSTTGSGGAAAYVDPCDEGGPYVGADYTDASLETVRRGGTVRAEGTAEQVIQFDPTVATIVRVSVRVLPTRHRTISGIVPPTVDLRRKDDAGEREIGSAMDSVDADYDKPHDLTIDIGDHQEAVDDDAPGTLYIVGITGEAGPGAQDIRICGTHVVTNPVRE